MDHDLRAELFLQDKPQKLAAVIVDFWKRNTTTLVLPPKIGGAPRTQPVKMVGEE